MTGASGGAVARPPTDDESLLRDAARELLTDACPPALLRAHRDDVDAAAPLWDALRDFVPLGLGPLAELCVLMEELGAVAAPVPYVATACLYAPLLDATGEHDLDPVLDGHATGTVACAGPDRVWRPNAARFKTDVPDGAGVDLVAAIDAAGAVTLLAGAPAARTVTADTTRCRYVVDTHGPGRPAGTVSGDTLAELLERARIALAAETVGTLRSLLDATGAVAELGPALGHARALVTVAADAFDAADPDRRPVSADARRAVHTVAARAVADAAGDPRLGPEPDSDLAFLLRRVAAAPDGLAAG